MTILKNYRTKPIVKNLSALLIWVKQISENISINAVQGNSTVLIHGVFMSFSVLSVSALSSSEL